MGDRESVRKPADQPVRTLSAPTKAVTPFGFTPQLGGFASVPSSGERQSPSITDELRAWFGIPLAALSQQDRQELSAKLEALVSAKDPRLTELQIAELRYYATYLRSQSMKALPMVPDRKPGPLDRRDPQEDADPAGNPLMAQLARLLGAIGLDDIVGPFLPFARKLKTKVTAAPLGPVLRAVEGDEGATKDPSYDKGVFEGSGLKAEVGGEL